MLRSVIAVGVLLLASCGAGRSGGSSALLSPKTPAAAPAPAATTQAISAPINREGCPAQTGGTRVGSEHVEGGAALVFTTPEDIGALRAQVSDMAMPIAMQKTDRRIDNIRDGVRLVFEASDINDVATLREAVGENARRIAHRCGLVLASPPDRKAAPSSSTSTQKPPAKSQEDSKESDAARTKKDAPKNGQPEPSAKPKDESKDKAKEKEKPKEAEKPSQPEKPKEDDKPKPPPPPPPPEPPPPPGLPRQH